MKSDNYMSHFDDIPISEVGQSYTTDLCFQT